MPLVTSSIEQACGACSKGIKRGVPHWQVGSAAHGESSIERLCWDCRIIDQGKQVETV